MQRSPLFESVTLWVQLQILLRRLPHGQPVAGLRLAAKPPGLSHLKQVSNIL